jgi:hypothetical protein
MVSEIEWGAEEAEVTMITGTVYTVDGEEYHALRKLVGLG